MTLTPKTYSSPKTRLKMNDSLQLTISLTVNLNSSTNAELERFHEELFGSPTAKLAQIILLVINHIIAPILLAGIIAYEKYGGDPQKRNTINRLQSNGIANIITLIEIQGMVRIGREIFGLIDFDVMIWVECFYCMCGCNAIFFFAEMSVLQTLYIVVWKRVKAINDEFCALFLTITTNVISFWVVLVDHTPHRMIIPNLMIHTANLEEPLEEIRYLIFYLSITCMV